MRDSLGRGYYIHSYNDCCVYRSAIKQSGSDAERVGSRRTPGPDHYWIEIAPHALNTIFGPSRDRIATRIIDQVGIARVKHKGAAVSFILHVYRERIQYFAGNICRKISLPLAVTYRITRSCWHDRG